MTRNNHNAPSTAHLVRYSLGLLLACVALLCAPAAHALDTGDVVIASLKGEVHVVMKGVERAVKPGTVLETPATVRTGHDGAIELRQGATSVSVGPDTLLEFPQIATRGGPIDRIVQPRGNAFYSIGKRPGRKLRVETPWLVGVVKGTQFNVAVQDDGATISLFEGLLQIRASDESSVIDIEAGQIATRRRGDNGIGVLKMDPAKPPAPRAPAGASSNGGAATPPKASRLASGSDDAAGGALGDHGTDSRPAAGTLMDDIGEAVSEVAGETSIESRSPAQLGAVAAVDVGAAGTVENPVANVDAGAGVDANVGVDAGAGVSAGAVSVDSALGAGAGAGPAATNVDVGVSTGVDAGAATVDVNAGAAIDTGDSVAANVDVGASAGLGNAVTADAGVGAAVDATGVTTNIDLGAAAGAADAASSDAGIGTDVDLGGKGAAATVDVNAGANAGPLSAGAGAGVAVDVGGNGGTAATVDLGANAGVGRAAAVDAGVDAAVNAGPATNVSANVDVGANLAGVTAGANLGVNAGAGNVDLGLDVGGANVNAGLDLGLGDQDEHGQDTANPGAPGNSNPGPGNGDSNQGSATDVVNDVVDDVGGLLNGLLKRPKRK